MSYAHEVRGYCARHIIEPARARGESEVAICAGDVHKAMGYQRRFPAVCSALGTKLFEETYRVRRKGVEGPLQGSTTVFRFAILP